MQATTIGNCRHTLSVLSLFLIPAVVLCGGCATGEGMPEPADHMGGYRRVTVLEFYYDAPHEDFGVGFGKLLADRLSTYTDNVDVNTVAPTEVRMKSGRPLDRGSVPVGFLTEMRRTFQSDAVILGRIDSFNPYYFDLSIGVSAKAVDTDDGSVIFSISRTWNAGELKRMGDMKSYYTESYGPDDIQYYGPDLMVISPSFFSRYIADRLARKILATFNTE